MTAQRTTGPHRSRRSHTLGGCRTCRRRHVKCDQKRPACRTCLALSIPCEGFSDEVRWMGSNNASNDGASGDRSGIRRQLYTEQSRRSMTTSLGNDLVSGSIDASLTEIDSRSRDGNHSAASDIVVGPFAVLNFASTPSDAGGSRAGDVYNEPSQHTQHVQNIQPGTAPVMSTFGPGLGNEIAPPGILSPMADPMNVMDDFLHWSDLLGFGNDSFSAFSQPLLDVDPTSETYAQFAAPSTSSGMDQWVPGAPSDQRNAVQFATTQQISLDTTSTELDVLSESQFLFKHFQNILIPQMMVMPLGDKCPWKILNLPAAVMTYSDITFLSSLNISHARSANLYGVLACSAIHLSLTPGTTTQADHWRQVANQAFNQAKEHMLLSLKHETQIPKKSKYKDQMMAICILAEFAILSGQQEHARCFMVDAERVLRMRGLPKRRISQKARLLHHVYTWLRIVGESTYVLHDYSQSSAFLDVLQSSLETSRSGRMEHETTPGNNSNPKLDDFLRLETHYSDNDLNIDDPKDKEAGLHDIHLQDSRNFPETMYKQIYGIPETWLSLVSQTTRLANVMDTFRMRSGKSMTLDTWEMLQRRSVRLENMICSFSLSIPGKTTDETNTARASGYMLQALGAALLIFFYRRIRNVHPAVLQGYVDSIVGALSEFNKALPQGDPAGPGTAWPAFIAGCEAITTTRRESITKWLDNAESMSGFTAFKTAKNIMFELWRKQDEHLRMNSGDPIPTWMDVVKQHQLWPLFC